MLILQGFLCRILNFLGRATESVSLKNRNRMVTCMFAMISISSYFYTISSYSVHLLFKCIIGGAFLLGVIVFSIDGNIKPIVWDYKIMILWIAFGAIRIVTGIVTSIEFLPLACIWLFAFPMFFLVWNNRKDYDTLFDCVYKGFLYPGLFFIIVSLLLREIGEVAYVGLTGNANSLGQHLCAMAPLVLMKYGFSKRKNTRVIHLVILCVIFALAFFSKSRTTGAALVGGYLVLLLCKIIVSHKRVKGILASAFLLSVGTVLAVVICLGINSLSMRVASDAKKQTVEKVKVDNLVKGYVDRIEGKDKQKEGIDDYSSGRTPIWREAVRKINVLGHPSRDHIITERNGDVGAFVHNNFLQFAYDNGVVAGILFLLLAIIGGLKAFILVIKHHDKEAIYVLVLHSIYFVISMLSTINLPFLYQISFLYYISYVVLSEKRAR